MSVIGRLDEQVEAVLINPLKRRQPSPPDEEAREPPPAPPAKDVRDDESKEEQRGRETSLPVWLL